MKHLRFTTYKNSRLQTITGQDLFHNKRVLICSLIRPYEALTEQYVQRLTTDIEWYKHHGIDEVYLINSCDGKLVLTMLESVWPHIPSLYDHDCEFVSVLKQHTGVAESVDFLSRYWNYQVLINNGQIEQFYGQPTRDYVKNLCRDGHGKLVMQLGWLAKEDESLTIWKPTARRFENDWNTFGTVHYYKLCPNLALKNYLETEVDKV